MFEMACAYSSNQKYSQAIPWFKQALAGRETILGKKHPLTLLTHHELAGSYVGNNELNQASMHFHTALEGREEVLGPEHPETLKTIHEIARLNSNQGDFHTALALYRRVCDERERKFGSSHESTLTSKHNLATAFKRDAKYAQALEVFAEVRRERLQSLGRSHPSTLGTTHEMASVYYFRKSYGKAIELAQEARAGREEKFGPLHSWTVASAMLLGNAYLESGNTEEALRFLKQGLTGYKHLPDSDTEVFATTCNIATIYRTRKEPAEALKWYLEALELGKKGSKGEDAMPSILDNIADLSEEVGKLDQALDFHQRAFGAKLKSPPQSGRSLQQSRFHIGRLQLGRGLHEQALVCFRRLLSEKDLLDKDLHIGTLVQICNVYALQDKIDESLETLQELLDLCRTEYGEDGELTKQSKRQMAAVYLKRQNRDNAFNEYEQALNWLQTEFDRDDPLTISFLCKVAASHYQQNMYSESISLYRAALEALDHNQENANHEIKELTLTVTSNIAAINSILGKYDKSLEYHQRALQLRERNCDANDPSVLENMHRIAALHVRKGSYEQALQTLRQVQHREVTTLGPRDPKPLTTLRCIGDVEGKCGRYEVALTCYQRALAGLEAMLDPNDTEVLITLHGLSGVHFSLGNVTACRTALERATASMERSPALGPGNLETLSAMQDLASLYDYLEQGSNALVWWKKALDGYRDKLGENHPSTRKASERVAAGPGGGDGNAFGHD